MLKSETEVRKKDVTGLKEFEDAMRRVEPFIKKLVKKPIKIKPWKSGRPSREIHSKRKSR